MIRLPEAGQLVKINTDKPVIFIVEAVGKVYLLTNERLNLHNFATFSEDFDLFYRLVGIDYCDLNRRYPA
jgi:hypothetical protein